MLFNIHTRRVGRRAAAAARRAARACCRRCARRARSTATVTTDLGVADRADRGIAGDQQAALFGQMCCRRGLAKNTYGTGCFMLLNTGTTPRRVAATSCSPRSRGRSAGGRSTRSKAASSSAARSCSGCATGSGSSSRRPTSRSSRATVPDSGGVYLVPAFAGLGAPHWDPYARGTIIGHHARHDRGAHRARRAREHRLSGRRSARGDAGGFRHRARTSCASTAARRERPADAVPGRHPRRAGRAAEGHRDDGARRGVPRRPRGRLLEDHRRDRRAQWQVERRFEPQMARPHARAAARALARSAVERARLGAGTRRQAANRA